VNHAAGLGHDEQAPGTDATDRLTGNRVAPNV